MYGRKTEREHSSMIAFLIKGQFHQHKVFVLRGKNMQKKSLLSQHRFYATYRSHL
jgi:hypothetical protein